MCISFSANVPLFTSTGNVIYAENDKNKKRAKSSQGVYACHNVTLLGFYTFENGPVVSPAKNFFGERPRIKVRIKDIALGNRVD